MESILYQPTKKAKIKKRMDQYYRDHKEEYEARKRKYAERKRAERAQKEKSAEEKSLGAETNSPEDK